MRCCCAGSRICRAFICCFVQQKTADAVRISDWSSDVCSSDLGITSWRTFSASAISSTAALPARSPMPLIVDSTCRAPAVTAASVLATARPRSLWQWVENRSEEHTSELPSLMRISYAVICLKQTIYDKFNILTFIHYFFYVNQYHQ